jgi:hypothetical protein
MKIRYAALAAQPILLCLASFPSPAHAQARETRPLDGFDAVEVSGGIDLVLRQGASFAVEVVVPDGDAAQIITEVRGNKLEIRRKNSLGFFDWGDHGSVNVTLPALKSLAASGGSDVRVEGSVSSDTLAIVASGGSDVSLEVAAGALDVEASGGSDLRLRGTARSANVRSSGGSDLNASQLTANEVDLQSSGGSDLSIAVRDKIVAHASGGSDISYTGQPSVVDVDTSGGADIHHR